MIFIKYIIFVKPSGEVTSKNVFSVLISVVGVGVGVSKADEVKELEVDKGLLASRGVVGVEGLEVEKMLLVTGGVVEAAVLCDVLEGAKSVVVRLA